MGPPPKADDCRDRREAKPADWLNVDRPARLVDDAPIVAEIARTDWLGPARVAHAWVGVDHDGSIFCTRVDTKLSPRLERAVRRALEAARYENAVVLGGAHYAYVHVDVKLYKTSNEEACAENEEACWFAAYDAAKRKDHAAEHALRMSACDKGLQEACVTAGKELLRGHGVARDVAKARALFAKACEANVANGCEELGRLAFSAHDYKRAEELFDKGCALFAGGACNMLGILYARGLGVEASQERALALYDEGCARGSLSACMSLGGRLIRGDGAAPDKTRGMRLLERVCAKDEYQCAALAGYVDDPLRVLALRKKACGAGHVMACAALLRSGKSGAADGLDIAQLLSRARADCDAEPTDEDSCYFAGLLLARYVDNPDIDEAMKRFDKGCTTRHHSCTELRKLHERAGRRDLAAKYAERACRLGGNCSRLTQLVDAARARKVHDEVCAGGDRKACVELAQLIAADEPARAIEIATDACKTHHVAHGCHVLGRVLAVVAEPAFRDAQAAAALREACDMRDGEACAELAVRYRGGAGVLQSDEKAAELERRACELDREQCSVTETDAATP